MMKCCISSLLTGVFFVAGAWSHGISLSTNGAERPQHDLVSFLQHAAHMGQGPLTQSSFMVSDGGSSGNTDTYVLLFPNITFEITVDRESKTLRLEGSDVTLTLDALAEMRKFLSDIQSVNGSQTTLVASQQQKDEIEGLILWLSEGDVGTVLSETTLQTTLVGVKCLRPGENVTVEWSDRSGHHNHTIEVGSELTYEGQVGDYRCMGMCGGGCNGKYYTRDCLVHDTCSYYGHQDKSSLHGLDPDCGSYWWKAVDDFVFGCR
mmetsp:Transcript_26397/g.54433  ORF Transcript_26397/g.54433 Transcript_26397/m.54433 type:complete len:263 (-) Transcript_26397:87-875(-)